MDAVTEFDGNLLIGIQETLNSDWLTPIMKAITMFGEAGIFWIAMCAVLLIFRKTRRLGIICSLSLVFTFICCNLVIKPVVDRTRPWVLFEAVHAYLPPPGDASFPSGHSANSMGEAFGLFLASMPARVRLEDGDGGVRYERSYDGTTCLGWLGVGASPRTVHRCGIAAVLLAVLIGLSRLYLGMHFPTDVICGLLLGMVCAAIVHALINKYEAGHGTIGERKR